MQAAASIQVRATNPESIRKAIAAKMPAGVYESWIAPLKVSVFENNLNIVAQNQFSADFIKRTYLNILESVAADLGLALSIGVGRAAQTVTTSVNDNNVSEFRPSRPLRVVAEVKNAFDDFIVSEENSFVVSAAKKLASGTVSFSPLFIYGAPGSGKTLLANCINTAANGQVLMMTGAGFVSEFLRAINEKSVFAFKDFCRNCDTFILDDVQCLSGKRACTDEFLSLVLDLIRNGTNVVLTANAAPASLGGFDRRVQSVLASGLTADLTAPNRTVRRLMLGRAGAPADVADALSGRIAADGHLVAGVLKKISAYSELMDEKVTVEVAERLLSDSLQKNKTPTGMVRAMCDKTGVSFDAVCSPARTRAIVRARQIMMFALKSATKLSLSEIGRLMGDRDHATVLYGIAQIESARKTDLILNAELEQMINECK
ncbi:MAG: DnaA/Hda family protein [Alphaproteobacteria bacterium]|nr:DnaA/Hda family protein [Alphaproteobacteria bacterium]